MSTLKRPRHTYQTYMLSQLIGTVQLIRLSSDPLPGDLQFHPHADPRIIRARIISAASPYGVPRVLIAPADPADGSGSAWVNADKLIVPDQPPTDEPAEL
jgi:hypothetical protein